MNPELIAALIAATGFLVSVGSALLIGGIRWGRVIQLLETLQTQQTANGGRIDNLTERVAKIEGMLTRTTVTPPT